MPRFRAVAATIKVRGSGGGEGGMAVVTVSGAGEGVAEEGVFASGIIVGGGYGEEEMVRGRGRVVGDCGDEISRRMSL